MQNQVYKKKELATSNLQAIFDKEHALVIQPSP